MDLNTAIADAVASLAIPTTPEGEAPEAPDNTEAVGTAAVETPDTSHDASVAEAVAAAKGDKDAPASDTDEDADVSDGDETKLPEGFSAPSVLTEGLATEFSLLDADGEIEVPNVTVRFKANGKMREERIDQVVKLAQFGVYNQEREEKIKAVESAVTERDQLAKLVEEREAQLERALTDPSFLAALQDAYERETSPEAEAKRARAETESLRTQQQLEKIQEVGQRFYETEVSPAFDMIAKAAPTVTVEELEEKFAMAMAAHAEQAPNGEPYVPPSRYEAVRQYIVDDLAVWAMAHHERRSKQASPAAAATPKPVAPVKTDSALVAQQQAKREVGKLTKPVGTAAKEDPKPSKSAQIANIDDAVSSALESVLASVR
jgi:hypothetical protein